MLDDELLRKVYGDADALRRAWAIEYADIQQNDFRLVPRCGEGTYKTTGRLCDGVRGMAQGARATDFVEIYRKKLQLSFTVGIIEHTEADARTLCTEWIQRMQFLLRIWIDSGHRADFVFPADAMAAYVEPPAFAALAARELRSVGLENRIQQIRNTFPTL